MQIEKERYTKTVKVAEIEEVTVENLIEEIENTGNNVEWLKFMTEALGYMEPQRWVRFLNFLEELQILEEEIKLYEK